MDIKHERIGNLLKDSLTDYTLIVKDFAISNNSYFINGIPSHRFKHIGLTEYWVEKLKVPEWIYEIQDINFEIKLRASFLHHQKVVFSNNVNRFPNEEIQFVHQLQNLYFKFFGKDLQTNEILEDLKDLKELFSKENPVLITKELARKVGFGNEDEMLKSLDRNNARIVNIDVEDNLWQVELDYRNPRVIGTCRTFYDLKIIFLKNNIYGFHYN